MTVAALRPVFGYVFTGYEMVDSAHFSSREPWSSLWYVNVFDDDVYALVAHLLDEEVLTSVPGGGFVYGAPAPHVDPSRRAVPRDG
ncbi:hypothetical protein [Deinococcus pimensis]|uniref:hypothetical protein n=1 Tax=Deinococcus pimensis TaxID=309888 RepID=UPI0004B1C501|nr:hypothetical protein [Deinococcus pimensis]